LEGRWGRGTVPAACGQKNCAFRKASLPEIVITYVNESNPAVDLTGSATSGMRAATVTVTRIVNGTNDQLAQVRRVFSYVATPGS
jgi:hypothetical protein